MSFIGDKMYNGYLRRNLPTIINRVKPKEIMNHLPCLTVHDRESITVKTETRGNFDGMECLLDCLKRREHWPEQFINALEECEHTTIAAELRAEYNALRGINDSSSSSPPTTVVRVHVHPVPSASHQSIQAVDAPAAPTEPAAPAPPPLEAFAQPQSNQSADNDFTKTVPSTASTAGPPHTTPTEVVSPPSTAANSPAQATVTRSSLHQQPEENSESVIFNVSGEANTMPHLTEPVIDNVSPIEHPMKAREIDSSDPRATPEEWSPRCSTPVEKILNVTNSPSSVAKTPEKPPVQETCPPRDKSPAAGLQPKKVFKPPTPKKTVESSPQRYTTVSAGPDPVAPVLPVRDESTVCLSKPTELVSINVENPFNHAAPAPSTPAMPFSGDSDCLEISKSVKPTLAPASPSVSPPVHITENRVLCQENGFTPNQNDPDENSCDSDVLTNVVHVSEEPSILNLDAQISTIPIQVINGEVTKQEPPSSTEGADEPVLKSSTHVSYQALDSAPELQTPAKSNEDTSSVSPVAQSANAKYILTAVGVGACALLMAWRFKN